MCCGNVTNQIIKPYYRILSYIFFRILDVSDLQLPKMLKMFTPTNANRKNKIALKRSIHQQDDGTVYAICATGTSTKDSLLSWIRLLEQNGNPSLAHTPVLFKFISKVDDQLPAIL